MNGNRPRLVETVAAMRRERRGTDGRWGLVPTMGALHAGHEALLRQARRECDTVVASIFVNPTQFGPDEDLDAYPRDLDEDLAVCTTCGVDVVLAPGVEELYSPGDSTRVEPGPLAALMEGAARPGHFVGVATVVVKLLGAVEPDVAYFGEKDAQQVAVVRRVVADLLLDVEIATVATVRAPDGLALSSRNAYLNDEERRAATVLYRALTAVAGLWSDGERQAQVLREAAMGTLRDEPLARPEYVHIAHPETFVEIEGACRTARVCLAVHVGPARLIDNLLLGPG